MPITEHKSSITAAEPPRAIMVVASFNAGKTHLSATASKFYPAKLRDPQKDPPLAEKDLAKLDDLYYNCWEPDCFAGFVEKGLAVPPHLDLSQVTRQELFAAVDTAITSTREAVKRGAEIVVVDTGSAFNTKLYTRAVSGVEKSIEADEDSEESIKNQSDKTKDGNQQKIFQVVLNTHMKYMDGILSSGARLCIFNFHVKSYDPSFRGSDKGAKGQAAKALHEINQKAKGLGDETKLAAEITGQAFQHYHRNCALILEPTTKTSGYPPKTERIVKVRSEDVLTRSKYACLADIEPAHIGQLITKIKAAGVVVK